MNLTENDINQGHNFMGKLLLTIGAITGGLTLADFDLYLSIFLKFISIASFICYLLINQDNIRAGWIKFKNKFKKK